jgi:hypothetical protein
MKRMITAATVLLALLASLLAITVMPGSSVLDLNIDVGIKVFAFYVAYIVWAALTVLLVNVFFTLWGTRGRAHASPLSARRL